MEKSLRIFFCFYNSWMRKQKTCIVVKKIPKPFKWNITQPLPPIQFLGSCTLKLQIFAAKFPPKNVIRHVSEFFSNSYGMRNIRGGSSEVKRDLIIYLWTTLEWCKLFRTNSTAVVSHLLFFKTSLSLFIIAYKIIHWYTSYFSLMFLFVKN